MRARLGILLGFLIVSAALSLADDKRADNGVFTGQITDSICARNGSHAETMRLSKDMGETPLQCTLICVGKGAKYVLYDPKHKKTYRLSDQTQAGKFAGRDVRVTGVLKKNEITVASIELQ
jgi:hypothetical protein